MCYLTCSKKFSRSIRKVAPAGSRKGQDGDPEGGRDKRHINAHIHIFFEDVLGEPGFDTPANSSDCVWINSYICYNCMKNCIYRTMSLVFALPAALLFGCLACTSAFYQIWALTPCHKCIDLTFCHCLRALNGMFWDCLVGPLAMSCGEIFWPFRAGGNPGVGSKGKVNTKGNKVSFNKKVKYKTIPSRRSMAI